MSGVWLGIVGFDGYFVSNLGRVKSVKRGGEEILKPYNHRSGYENFRLHSWIVQK